MTTGPAARPTRQAPLYGGLLVGGASRRMGRPKALLATADGTLAERAAAALRPAVERLVLLGDGPVPASLAGLPRLVDAALPGAAAGPAGPLGGLLAALRWAPQAAWVLCPCDLPRVRPEAVRWLAAQRRPERLAVLPRAAPGGPPEPLLALYEPGVRPAVEALAAAGGRAPRRLAGSAGVAEVEVPPELADCWRDADTPGEMAAAGMPPSSS
jgi:molybdenum cofactor guanylyltransferase